jgi:SAM-dependent methyltransferase
MDPIEQFKQEQKVRWAGFAALENVTGSTAPALVRFVKPRAGATLLDVGCGTGVVGLTAARLGLRVTGIDLTPELIARAKQNAELACVEADWLQEDAENLPFDDQSFDYVVSQFGHMFAPRPEVVTAQMLRVLKPGGTIAFSTWPPELFVGRSFALIGKYAPPPPPGVSPPVQWGDPHIVRERLGAAVKNITFTRSTMVVQTLSPGHYRVFMEQNFGPLSRLLSSLDAAEPTKADALRRELEELAAEYFEDNVLRQDYLLTRAIKI